MCNAETQKPFFVSRFRANQNKKVFIEHRFALFRHSNALCSVDARITGKRRIFYKKLSTRQGDKIILIMIYLMMSLHIIKFYYQLQFISRVMQCCFYVTFLKNKIEARLCSVVLKKVLKKVLVLEKKKILYIPIKNYVLRLCLSQLMSYLIGFFIVFDII